MVDVPRWARPSQNRNRVVVFCLILLALISVLWITAYPRFPTPGQATFTPDPRLDMMGRHGAVACDVGQCSQMGVDVLRSGGNAADSSVVVALCIGSVNAQSSGIGGGGFITVRAGNGSAMVIDCRETAPAKAHKHMYDGEPLKSKIGGLAVGVPGEIAGLQALFDEFGSGKFTWKQLVDQVADFNDKGFMLSPAVAESVDTYKENFITEHGGWEWLLANSSSSDAAGVPRKVYRPQLAKTLRTIANGGAQAFYDPNGEIAQSLARIAQLTGGILTPEDFGNYTVEIRQPLNTTFMGREIFTTPAPTSGPALIFGLHLIEELLEADSYDLSPVDTQRLIETMKWIAAGRSELGDPAFSNNSRMYEITTPEWADVVRGNISDERTLPSWRDYHPAYENVEPHGTAHFSVVDNTGMAVGMTTTVNLLFGCMVEDPVTGVVLNSEMDDFSQPDADNFFELAPSIYNFIQPGKRPLSSTCPTIATLDGSPELVIGAAGGSRIVTSVFQALVRTYGYGVPLLETISYPRLHHQLLPEVLFAENGVPGLALEAIAERGHVIESRSPSSAMNGIRRIDGFWHAVSDYYRKWGLAAAY